MSNDKFDATFHGSDDEKIAAAIKVVATGQRIINRFSTHDEGPAVLDEVSVADMLCDQFQLFTEEGGNDLQGEYVDEVTLGGRIVTVDWTNGQQFQIEVREVIR